MVLKRDLYALIVAAVAATFVTLWLNFPTQPVHAQLTTACDTTVAITVTAAGTASVFSAIPGATPYVCAYHLSSSAAGTTLQFQSGNSGGTNLTGQMLGAANAQYQAGDGAGILIQGLPGLSLIVAANTGNVAGWIRGGNH